MTTEKSIQINTRVHVGDQVYYIDHHKDSVPAIVRQIRKNRILIAGNFIEGNRCVWVSPSNCELQR